MQKTAMGRDRPHLARTFRKPTREQTNRKLAGDETAESGTQCEWSPGRQLAAAL